MASQNQSTTKGFTLVELLIVIVVIAILVAISVVAYNGIQGRAADSAVQGDLRQFGQTVIMHHTDIGSYPRNQAQFNAYGGVKATHGAYADGLTDGATINYLYCFNTSDNTFGLVARSRSGKYFQYRDGKVSPYTGSVTTGVGLMCPRIGVTYDGRVWLFNDDIWQL